MALFLFSLNLCSVRSLTGYGEVSSVLGTVWRFLPMADPAVDVVIVRDLDSRYKLATLFFLK